MHIKEIIIKNEVYIYNFDNLFKAKKLENKCISVNEKNYILLDMFTENKKM